MSRSVDIDFQPGLGSLQTWVFVEDLSRRLTLSGLGVLPMAEADAVKTHLRVTAIQKRELRRCLVLIESVLKQHFMHDRAVVSVVAPEAPDD